MSLEPPRSPWGRWLAEFFLILGSVYLAVYLESSSQARSEQIAARTALTQLLGELKEDERDFQRIIASQTDLDRTYRDLLRWLADPDARAADSVGAALYRIATDNPTIFARRASWSTMIASGQLADLDAPDLVLRLGQLYETIYSRIDYNSRFYDEDLNTVLRDTRAVRWQELDTRPLVADAEEVELLAQTLARLHFSWNVWYRDLLVGYEDDLHAAVAAVEEYLGA